jgi:hypothetical protein
VVHGRPFGRLVLGLEDRDGHPEGVGLMARLVGIVLALMVALMLAGFVLAHFGIVVLLCLGIALLGRHLRRHGV